MTNLPATTATRLPALEPEPSLVAALVQPRISELGKIKIGGKSVQVRTSAKGTEWRAPEKFDHFIITTLQRDERGDLVRDEALMAELAQSYADKDGKLRRIPIMLLSNRIDDIVQASYVWYASKKLGARSDGHKITFYVNPENRQPLPKPVEKEWTENWSNWKDNNGNRLFKLHTIFNCVVASKLARWGGVYKFRTTSRISASQLVGSLQQLQLLTGGVLRGLPLQLVVRPIQVSPEGKATNVFVVHVELLGSDIQAIQDRALALAQHDAKNHRQMLAIECEYRKMLAVPGVGETDDDVTDLQQEFHPEGNDGPRTTTVDDLSAPKKSGGEPASTSDSVDAEFEDIESGEPESSPESFSQEQKAPEPPEPMSPEELEAQNPNAFDEFMAGGKTEPATEPKADKVKSQKMPASDKRGSGCPEWKACGIGNYWLKFGGPALEKVARDYILVPVDKMTGAEIMQFATKIQQLEASGELKPKAATVSQS